VFLTFEGIDGCGKSTQAELLADELRGRGREVVLTREPGGTALGERVRELLLHGDDISAWAEAALFAAARAELVATVIRPALDRGAVVVCDRFLDSSLAYQGIARRLSVDRILELNAPVLQGVLPDRTFLLLVDPDEARARRGADSDRMERGGEDFLRRVDGAYRDLAQIFPERIVTIDAALPPELVARLVRGALEDIVAA
jgi:dTMP kinase